MGRQRNIRMSIEKNLIHSLSPRLLHFSPRNNSFRFHCPYCQVGQKNSKGKPFSPGDAKGFLYKKNGGWNFKCHRERHCGLGMTFTTFLEQNFPNEFLKYVRLREEHGTSGFQTNCPSLVTALQRQGSLPNHPPKFHDPTRAKDCSQTPPEAPVRPLKEVEQSTGPKITKLPPMRSPAEQYGHQSRINKEIKQRQKRRIERSGELW